MFWFGEPQPSDAELAEGVRLVRLINTTRREHNLNPLTHLEILDNTAWIMVLEMLKLDYTKGSHLDTQGLWPSDRAKKVGYLASVTESLASNARSAQAALDSWMRKPEDRKNILRRDLWATGVAIHKNNYVQVFGTESSKYS